MFVITADQVNSRATADIVGETISRVNTRSAGALLLPADRTAGDELQLLVASAEPALQIILDLTRTGRWSVGCGFGAVNQPLPSSIREAAGSAFIAARAAVDRAKKRPTRFALEHEAGPVEAADTEAFIDLLLVIRARRSVEGWELYDLMTEELTQAQAADRLGISPQAASKRAKAAELRAERAAIAPLLRAMARLGTLRGSGRGEAP
ncbi:MAG TPA: DNA-binding protein [Terrimesophilobacter sp.]|uniref:DNA-binding protein n=1 Tax=Terrimesophilobacter sp. TaxID=2906435 RepID=UPI002F94CFF0